MIDRHATFRLRLLIALCGAIVTLAGAAPALAVQHLIRPGEEWQHLAPRLRPGDEIVLMPGRHRGGSLDRIAGQRQRPIVIRSADPANPSIIEAGREGIRLRHARHVVIRDLAITGASINGITLGTMDVEAGSEAAAPGDIIIRHVSITRTGPRGLRHGVLVQGQANVRIEDCRIEGWGGSAVEIVASSNVQVRRTQMKGLADHSQMAGVTIRAGSEDVEIEECRIENGPGAAAVAVKIGDASRLTDFPPRRLEDAAPNSLAEAARVRVQRCIIVDAHVAIALIHASECWISNNTIVRPRQFILALLLEHEDARFTREQPCVFGRNLVVWNAGDLTRLVQVNQGLDVSRFVLDANLLWTEEHGEARDRLGGWPGKELQPQVVDVDPRLDETFRPRNPNADGFGI